MIPRVKPEGMLVGKPLHTFSDHPLAAGPALPSVESRLPHSFSLGFQVGQALGDGCRHRSRLVIAVRLGLKGEGDWPVNRPDAAVSAGEQPDAFFVGREIIEASGGNFTDQGL